MIAESWTPLQPIVAAFREGPRRLRVLPYRGLEIGSAFQPIYSLNTNQVAGHEALLRCSDPTIDPRSLFKAARHYFETLDLSDAARILHLHNYAALNPPPHIRVFVPTLPETLSNPVKAETLEACLDRLALPPSSVVLELPTDTIERIAPEALVPALQPFRELGCAVAANGYDAGTSLESVWCLRPEFVKFEASMLPARSSMPDASALLGGLVATFRSSGVRTVMKGIESASDLTAACAAGCELGQGFHLHPPHRNGLASGPASPPPA